MALPFATFVPHFASGAPLKLRSLSHILQLTSLAALRHLCSCCKASQHTKPNHNCIAASAVPPPCNRHLPVASGTGTKAMRLHCWHKAMLMLRIPRRCKPRCGRCFLLRSSQFRSSPRLLHGGWWRTVSLPSLPPRCASGFVHPGFPARGLQCISQL
jgi:hypothetical protein